MVKKPFGQYLTWAMAIVALLRVDQSNAENVITLVAGERPPYVGETLPRNGYAFELVEEAFKRKSYRVNIKFVPWARAQMLVDSGHADGIFPVEQESKKSPSSGRVLSAPFPGGVVGFLKKTSLAVVYPKDDAYAESNFIQSLRHFRIGAVRGGVAFPALDKANFENTEMVSTDLLNLDKLSVDRIQLALIDKYSAADLMINQRPNLIGEFDFIPLPFFQKNFHIAFSPKAKNQRTLLRDFNEGLAELMKDGTLENILNKHGLFQSKMLRPDRTKITIGTVNNQDMLMMQHLSREFQKQHPHIELAWRVLDENTLRVRLLGDLAISDGQFDIMTIGA